MPLWVIYHPVGTFEDEASKQAFAEDITAIYTGGGLPAFYVTASFIKLSPDNYWVGGKKRPADANPFIRIQIDHIAVHQKDGDLAAYSRVCDRVERALKPHIADKGYDWEFHIDETERGLWRINGLAPPPHKSEAEKVWAMEDKPLPWEGKL